MALGARTLIRSWNDAEGLHHLLVSMPGTTGANLVSAGETIDLSTAGTAPTGGATSDLFPSAVHGMLFQGFQGAPGRRVTPKYQRDTAGAPATGQIVFEEVGAAGGFALTADNTNLSTTTFLLEFVGR